MYFIQRLHGWVPPILEAPRDPTDYLVHRIDGSMEPIALGTSLTVRENEIAALVVDNYVTNVLAPGIYRLDREHLGELEAIFSWSADYTGAIGADIYFVSATSAKRHLWQSRPGEGISINGSTHAFDARGTIDFTVSDNRRFLSCHIEGGRHDDVAIRRALDRFLLVELRALISEPGCTVDALTTNLRETNRILTKRLAPTLGNQGINEFSIRIRRLEIVSGDASGISQKSSVPTSLNVTPLPRNLNEPAADEVKLDSPVTDDDPSELDVLLDIEQELEKLDAWSTIAQGYGQMDSVAQALEDDEADVIRPRLPPSFHELGFYIAVDMQQSGPFDVDEFEHAIGDGSVDERTLIWFQGLEDWKPAGEIAEIAELIEAGKLR